MKMHDIIRSMINFIDNIDNNEPQIVQQMDNTASPLTHANTAGDDINRFKQIVDLADEPMGSVYSNEPNPAYADIDAVTINAGGGLNGPKHPADIRVKDPSATPHLIGQDFEQHSDEHPAHIVMIKSLRGL